ncbi:hypothetical protein JXB27_00745 [Candidatus Woesearchaeota archaeon]|nr:hypothetical protein [Candidatus Woesearchaeota archaeon]
MGFHGAMAAYEDVNDRIKAIEKTENVPLKHISEFSVAKFSAIKDKIWERLLEALDALWDVLYSGELKNQEKKIEIISQAIANLTDYKLMFERVK